MLVPKTFLTEDMRVGPSVYTANEQFIKPMTKAAGDVSWALMKHPEGFLVLLLIFLLPFLSVVI